MNIQELNKLVYGEKCGTEYNLYSEFDADKHKEKYPHYLEVVIDEDGVVHYAVPSHQEYLIHAAMKMKNVTRQQLDDMCPQEYYFDFIKWLCIVTGYVSVWTNGIICHSVNERQQETILMLIEKGILEVSAMSLKDIFLDSCEV